MMQKDLFMSSELLMSIVIKKDNFGSLAITKSCIRHRTKPQMCEILPRYIK